MRSQTVCIASARFHLVLGLTCSLMYSALVLSLQPNTKLHQKLVGGTEK
jgi:hypothetical protein